MTREGGLQGSLVQFVLGRDHLEGAPRDVIVAPFDDDSIAALVLDGVGDVVELVAHVLDVHLFAGSVWSVHAHHQHVGTWMVKGAFNDCTQGVWFRATQITIHLQLMDGIYNVIKVAHGDKSI